MVGLALAMTINLVIVVVRVWEASVASQARPSWRWANASSIVMQIVPVPQWFIRLGTFLFGRQAHRGAKNRRPVGRR
jgi:hypothetical protein